MNDELAALLAERGGIFEPGSPPTSLDKVFRQLAIRVDSHLKYAKELYDLRPRGLTFNFISNHTLNAFAYASRIDERPAFDFIGVHATAPITLFVTFQHMLARPDIFPEVGDPSQELLHLEPIDYLSTDVIRDSIPMVVPRCRVRGMFAWQLTVLAFDFLFLHELTHLRNGHLELWRERGLSNVLVEAYGPPMSSEVARLRRTLESDADAGAILLTTNVAQFMGQELAQGKGPSDHDERKARVFLCGTQKQATHSATFAAYVIFRLFDHDKLWDWPSQKAEPYPKASLRLYMIAATTKEFCRTRPNYGYDPETFDAEQDQVILAAERACARIAGQNLDVSGITSVTGPGLDEFTRDFQSCWKEIVPELEKHKRGGRLAGTY